MPRLQLKLIYTKIIQFFPLATAAKTIFVNEIKILPLFDLDHNNPKVNRKIEKLIGHSLLD